VGIAYGLCFSKFDTTCNKVRSNWLYNRANIIYDEEIESISARFLLIKFFTFIYVLERTSSLLDRAFV
jgi:hypothetical protein